MAAFSAKNRTLGRAKALAAGEHLPVLRCAAEGLQARSCDAEGGNGSVPLPSLGSANNNQLCEADLHRIEPVKRPSRCPA